MELISRYAAYRVALLPREAFFFFLNNNGQGLQGGLHSGVHR